MLVTAGATNLLLDGQQRLATATILLSVLRDARREYSGDAAARLQSKYISEFDDATGTTTHVLTLNVYDRDLPPWPHADPAESGYTPPAGRGRPRITDDDAVATWLAIQPGLTPHGLRHGHQTWMEELGTPYILVADRMGHEVPGMRGTYGHVSDGMRTALKEALQALWEQSLTERLHLSPRSTVPVLDALLQERQTT